MAASQQFQVVLEGVEGMDAALFRVPFDVKEVFGTRARVPVCGTLNGRPFRSSITPMGGGAHCMVVNKALRAAAGVRAGDMVAIVLERDDELRVVTPPPDLAAALAANPAAQAMWACLNYTHQREYAAAVDGAKTPATRARRIAHAVDDLAAGKRPPG